MKTYDSVEEAMIEAKSRSVKLVKRYFVNNQEVSPSEFRVCEKPMKCIYRSGLDLIIEK